MFLQLFLTYFKIGTFTLGGGYAMLPLIQREIVERKHWISEEEFIKFGGNKCIDCGLCSFVCPSNIEVAQIIKTSKVFN